MALPNHSPRAYNALVNWQPSPRPSEHLTVAFLKWALYLRPFITVLTSRFARPRCPPDIYLPTWAYLCSREVFPTGRAMVDWLWCRQPNKLGQNTLKSSFTLCNQVWISIICPDVSDKILNLELIWQRNGASWRWGKKECVLHVEGK